jgi:hypothetical protein
MDSNDLHRDIYLEMLKKAEKETDAALVAILRERIKSIRPQPVTTHEGCRLYQFPRCGESGDVALSQSYFRQEDRFWQDLAQFIVILSVFIAWFVFFCHLLAVAPRWSI